MSFLAQETKALNSVQIGQVIEDGTKRKADEGNVHDRLILHNCIKCVKKFFEKIPQLLLPQCTTNKYMLI